LHLEEGGKVGGGAIAQMAGVSRGKSQASSGAEWAVWDVWDSGSGCGDPECVWTICSGEQGTDSRLMLYV
jgi:hypothetical protein